MRCTSRPRVPIVTGPSVSFFNSSTAGFHRRRCSKNPRATKSKQMETGRSTRTLVSMTITRVPSLESRRGAGTLHEKRSPVRNDDAEDARRPTRAQALRRLAALYRQADSAYERFSCPSSAECCQLRRRGRQPWLWPVESAALEDALRRQGRRVPEPRADGGCPLLDEAGRRCTVYEDRPFGCRTYFCDRASGGRHPL